MEDCAAMAYVPGGGSKSCSYGCLGYGNCVKACPFDAIHIVNGIAVVDKDACKACGIEKLDDTTLSTLASLEALTNKMSLLSSVLFVFSSSSHIPPFN